MTTYTRVQWGALPSAEKWKALKRAPYGVIHHLGEGEFYPRNVFTTLRSLQQANLAAGYPDIVFSHAVDRLGNHYELRGDVPDDATLGFSGRSYSVLALCNAINGFQPTGSMLSAVSVAFRRAMERDVLDRHAYIEGHAYFDVTARKPTSCPGVLEQHMHDIQTLVHGSPPPPRPIDPPEPEL